MQEAKWRGMVDEKLKNIDGSINRVEDKLDKFIDKADEIYAPLWVKDAMKGIMGLIGAILLALLGLWLKK